MCTDERHLFTPGRPGQSSKQASQVVQEEDGQSGSQDLDHDWDLLAVQTIPEMGIRSSIPDGVDYVMTINGEELA